MKLDYRSWNGECVGVDVGGEGGGGASGVSGVPLGFDPLHPRPTHAPSHEIEWGLERREIRFTHGVNNSRKPPKNTRAHETQTQADRVAALAMQETPYASKYVEAIPGIIEACMRGVGGGAT